jgi:hypothetical protein
VLLTGETPCGHDFMLVAKSSNTASDISAHRRVCQRPVTPADRIPYRHSPSRTDRLGTTPGSVKPGNAFDFGAGIAFAFNERASLSWPVNNRIDDNALLRPSGKPRTKVVGNGANAGSLKSA